jgi:hypothetical protein
VWPAFAIALRKANARASRQEDRRPRAPGGFGGTRLCCPAAPVVASAVRRRERGYRPT